MELKTVAIVAENASRKMGGEAGLNMYYFDLLRKRNIDVWIVCHARVKEEIRAEFPDEKDFQKFYFIEDNWLQAIVWQISQWVPYRIHDLIFGQLLHFLTQIRARQVVKRLIEEQNIQLIFEPTPITPKGISFMYNMGVPVVIGPLSGGLEFPPAFRYMDSKFSQIAIIMGRIFSEILQRLIPGKLEADTLIVANQLTEAALPRGYKGKVYQVIDCGVDLEIYKQRQYYNSTPNQLIRFIYITRFVDWKGIQFLIEAFQEVATQTNSVLELVGDGELRKQLETQVAALNIQKRVNFHGWMKREECYQILCQCDVFIMPSLREACGCALMEAMAVGLPAIASKWAGPATILDPSCGILVEPTSNKAFVDGLAQAMIKLAKSPELRYQMGNASSQKVTNNYFDWDGKIDRIIEIFQETLLRHKQSNVEQQKEAIAFEKNGGI